MKIVFEKFNGVGNDFVMIDNRDMNFPAGNAGLIQMLCDRHFGIGADGLILIENMEGHDFKMVYFNSDGNPSSMCGNGGRCSVGFAFSKNICGSESKFVAIDGTHNAFILQEGLVKLSMNTDSQIEIAGDDYIIQTGSPHLVRFVNGLKDLNVFEIGNQIRNSERFIKEGINSNFVEIANDEIKMRTYERGVENETLSCGTGTVAVALAVSEKLNYSVGTHSMHIEAIGGHLKVHFNKNENGVYDNVWLEGPISKVFHGEIII